MPATAAAVVAAVVRPEIRALAKYAVAKAGGMIKLDAMESPFELPAAVRAKVAAAAAVVPVNRYPDGGADALKAAIVETFDLPGADRADPRQRLGRADPAHHDGAGAAGRDGRRARAVVRDVPDRRALRRTALRRRAAAPPISRSTRRDGGGDRARASGARLARLPEQSDRQPVRPPPASSASLRAAPGLVVVDEAYHAFAGASFLPRGSMNSRTCSCCARCPRSAWRGCGSGTPTAHPSGSPSSTRCGRRIISTH